MWAEDMDAVLAPGSQDRFHLGALELHLAQNRPESSSVQRSVPRASVPRLAEGCTGRSGNALSSLLIMKIWQARSGAVPLHFSPGF